MYDVFVHLCQQRGVSPSRVALDLGMSKNTMTDWKKGRSSPKTDKLMKIADYFGVTVEYLMTGKETVHEPYYYNEETRQLADYAFKNPDYKLLMSASRDLSPDDLKYVLDLVERLKNAR